MASERQEQVGKAISDAFQAVDDHPSDRGVVLSWCVVAEVMGDDGQVWLKSIVSEMPAWRLIGMLRAVAIGAENSINLGGSLT